MSPPLTLQMCLLASCDCDRKGGIGRAIDGKNNTVKLCNYIQSKSKLLSRMSVSPHTNFMRRNILSLKQLQSLSIQCLFLSFFLIFNSHLSSIFNYF